MKHLFYLLIIIAVIVPSSCKKEHVEPNGMWEMVKTDKKELDFEKEGGTQTIKTTNYKIWWINFTFDNILEGQGKWEYVNLQYPEEGVYDYIDCGWYTAKVDPEKKYTLTVTVTPNTTAEHRVSFINMNVGDVSISIPIVQK